MTYMNIREFIRELEYQGELKRVTQPVSMNLEITEICQRTLKAGGPALLFENHDGGDTPVLGNLFGKQDRIALALGLGSIKELRDVGKQLAAFKNPSWPTALKDAVRKLPEFGKLRHISPRTIDRAPCAENIIEGEDVDLASLPVQTCWPKDAGPLITFGLVITRGPDQPRQNIGIYRQQVIGRNKVIMRWLSHRGGATDFRAWCARNPGGKFPVAVAIGADPATLLAAVTPIPDTLSEFQFAGLLRGARTEVSRCTSLPLDVPASSEFVLEGHIDPREEALEGPFGDHTGYYNSQEQFPVLTVDRITHRNSPIYHTTYMGRSPHDEPSILAMALNEVFIPILQTQFPEIIDFYLPPEACSYRIAVVSIKKQYAGHARRIMFGVWSYLRQFTYTKFVIVVDDDIDARNWQEVMWAISTRMDPSRDTAIIENTPVDYLDFASPVSGLGSKMGFDATNKWSGEVSRPWGEPIQMTPEVIARVDQLWDNLY